MNLLLPVLKSLTKVAFILSRGKHFIYLCYLHPKIRPKVSLNENIQHQEQMLARSNNFNSSCCIKTSQSAAPLKVIVMNFH